MNTEKMEVLKEFCKEYNHFYNYPYKEQGAKIKTFDEWVSEPKISALLQSLFSPAQPTGLDLKKMQEKFDKMFETETPESFEKFCNEKVRERPGQDDIQESNCSHKDTNNSAIQPANEPVEPTGEIYDWITREGLRIFPNAFVSDEPFSYDENSDNRTAFRAGANALYAHQQPRIAELEHKIIHLESLHLHTLEKESLEKDERIKELEIELAEQEKIKEGMQLVIDSHIFKK